MGKRKKKSLLACPCGRYVRQERKKRLPESEAPVIRKEKKRKGRSWRVLETLLKRGGHGFHTWIVEE